MVAASKEAIKRETTSTQVRVSPDSKSRWTWHSILWKSFGYVHLFYIELRLSKLPLVIALVSVDSMKTAGGKVFLGLLLSENRECYFTELFVNLSSPGCPGVSTPLRGPCSLVLSQETWVWDVDGIVEVFPVLSSRTFGQDSTMCSWDVDHFLFPALIWPPVLHFPFSPLKSCSLKECHLTPFEPINLPPSSWSNPSSKRW